MRVVIAVTNVHGMALVTVDWKWQC